MPAPGPALLRLDRQRPARCRSPSCWRSNSRWSSPPTCSAARVSLVDGILAELHSNTVSMELMQHAAGLDLRHFESSEYQDRLERARRQAAGRNALLSQIFGQGQAIITVADARRRPLRLRAVADPAAARLAHPVGASARRSSTPAPIISAGCARRSGASSNICATSAPVPRPPRRSSCSGWDRSWSGASSGSPTRSYATTAASRSSAPSGAALFAALSTAGLLRRLCLHRLAHGRRRVHARRPHLPRRLVPEAPRPVRAAC